MFNVIEKNKLDDEQLGTASWAQIEDAARGTEVYWTHWRGDPAINKFTDEYVAAEMLKRYNIKVITVSGQGAELVSRLLVDKQAGVASGGKVDLMWINGETFH